MLLVGGRWLLIYLISQRRRPFPMVTGRPQSAAYSETPVRPGSMAVLNPILSPAQVVVTQWD